MLVFPKAKINLGLFIIGKRPDGYHNIETIFYPVNLCDALELVLSCDGTKVDSLTLTGYYIPGKEDDNIVLKALRLLRKNFHIPSLRIHLHKSIPPGAGLGGGSSDAACMLRTLNRLFNLSMGIDELKVQAALLGSDAPFFIDCQPSLASGRGEILAPVPNILDGYYIVLINPGLVISTKEAYESCVTSKPDISLNELIEKPVQDWKKLIVNDFEKNIFIRYPELKVIKQDLSDSGALYTSMSGSGSTVYGIFSDKPALNTHLRNNLIYEGKL